MANAVNRQKTKTGAGSNTLRPAAFNKRNMLAVALVVVALGGYLIYNSSRAATYAPLCLTYASQLCIQTYGSSDAKVQTNAASKFTFNYVGRWTYLGASEPTYTIENESGNCLYAYNLYHVKVVGCNPSSQCQQWAATSTSPLRLLSVCSDEAKRAWFLGAVPIVNNTPAPLEVYYPSNGYYWGWSY